MLFQYVSHQNTNKHKFTNEYYIYARILTCADDAVGGLNALDALPDDDDDDEDARLITEEMDGCVLLLLLLLVKDDIVDVVVAAAAVAGLHCSMARNKSKSQRRNTNSRTERLRCGNS